MYSVPFGFVIKTFLREGKEYYHIFAAKLTLPLLWYMDSTEDEVSVRFQLHQLW
jgi:hypothetical protein